MPKQNPKNPLFDKGFLEKLIKKMSKKDLIFLVMILFFAFVLMVPLLMKDITPSQKFLVVLGMFMLIAIYLIRK